MSAFFSSGHAVDVILVVLGLEAMTLIAMRRGKSIATVATATGPGICLLLALRESLIGGRWQWIAFWLILSFPAHLMDLWRRPL
jgi:hypothetical protein